MNVEQLFNLLKTEGEQDNMKMYLDFLGLLDSIETETEFNLFKKSMTTNQKILEQYEHTAKAGQDD